MTDGTLGHKMTLQSYYVNVGVLSPKTYTSRRIVFGAPMPSSRYWVVATPVYSGAYWDNVSVTVGESDINGFTLHYGNSSDYTTDSDVFVAWIAICWH